MGFPYLYIPEPYCRIFHMPLLSSYAFLTFVYICEINGSDTKIFFNLSGLFHPDVHFSTSISSTSGHGCPSCHAVPRILPRRQILGYILDNKVSYSRPLLRYAPHLPIPLNFNRQTILLRTYREYIFTITLFHHVFFKMPFLPSATTFSISFTLSILQNSSRFEGFLVYFE